MNRIRSQVLCVSHPVHPVNPVQILLNPCCPKPVRWAHETFSTDRAESESRVDGNRERFALEINDLEVARFVERPQRGLAGERDERHAAAMSLIERFGDQTPAMPRPRVGPDHDIIDLPVHGSIQEQEAIGFALLIAMDGHELHPRPDRQELAPRPELRGDQFRSELCWRMRWQRGPSSWRWRDWPVSAV